MSFTLPTKHVSCQLIGKATYGTFVLKNAEIHTVNQGIIQGSVVIEDGKISQLGDVSIPTDAEVIDCSNKRIYPGFIDAGSSLGLKEIGSVSLTNDANEVGRYNPQMKALTAVNPNSILIPVTRVNGITTVLAKPEGGIYSGKAALINLWGYTPKQMDAGFQALVIQFPQTGKRGRWDKRSEDEIKKDSEKAIINLNSFWEKAVEYNELFQKTNGELSYVPELDAMRTVLNGEMKVIIECNSKEDILQAIHWSQQHKISPILSGVSEGYMVIDSIKKYGLSVIVGPVLDTPGRSSDSYDINYKNPGLLQKAGIKVCLRTNDNENGRNLPYHAGFSAAYGMGIDEALKAITINSAEIFGVEKDYGSIEIGKKANLFISDGDPFETKTTIEQVFIEGWKIPMESRHSLLYDEFLERNPGIKE